MPIPGLRWASTLRTLLPGSVFQGLTTDSRLLQQQVAEPARIEMPAAFRYSVLRWYYQNNSLYDRLAAAYASEGASVAAMRGLRNPAYRIVEFYPANVWPGDLPAALPLAFPRSIPQGQAERLSAAIRQVWQWSNWASDKQVFLRTLATTGDAFLKIVQPPGSNRVYFELIQPEYVVDFDLDSRGHVVWIRVDIPQEERQADGTVLRFLHVETWSKATGEYRRWRLDAVGGVLPHTLGDPDEVRALGEFGIDFVPFVHCKFQDVGERRGLGAFVLQLDKIDELNREATAVSQRLYRYNRKNVVVETPTRDPAARPGDTPSLLDAEASEDDEIMILPSGSTAHNLNAGVDYEQHREWILDGIRDLEGDCPELAYWRIQETASGNDLSGRAIRFMLGPAITKCLEVRGRAEDALARANMMALSIGQAARLPLFQGIGDYASGALEHYFAPREVIPLSDHERAEAALVWWQAAVLQSNLGVSAAQIFRERGYSAEQIATMRREISEIDVIPDVEQ